MNEDQVLVQKVWRQLESEMLQEWMDSEVKLSSQYEFINKVYRFNPKNHDFIQQLKHEGRS